MGVTIVPSARNTDPAEPRSYFTRTYRPHQNWDEDNPNSGRVALLAYVKMDDLGDPYFTTKLEGGITFISKLASETDGDLVRGLVGMIVAVSLKIDSVIQGMSKRYGVKGYAVNPDIDIALLPLNPTQTQIKAMKPGSKINAQGRLVELFQYYASVSSGESATVRWKLKSSRDTIVFATQTGHGYNLCYGGGYLHKVYDGRLFVGEELRIVLEVTEDDELITGFNQPFLLSPSWRRIDGNNKLRQRVAADLSVMEDMLEVDDDKSFRYMFSKIAGVSLTWPETQALEKLVERLPRLQRPVRSYERDYWGRYGDIYGFSAETLSIGEFLDVIREWLAGERPELTRVCVGDMFLHLHVSEFTVQEVSDIFSSCLWKTLESLEVAEDEDERDDMSSFVRLCFSRMSEFGISDLARQNVDCIDYCLVNGYYGMVGRPHMGHESILQEAMDSLVGSALYQLPLTLEKLESWVAEIKAIPMLRREAALNAAIERLRARLEREKNRK